MSSKLFYGEIEENYNDTDFLPEKLCILGEKGKIMYISGKKRILYYPTNLTPGSNIYDAVTGSRFPYFEAPLIDLDSELLSVPIIEYEADIILPSLDFALLINQLRGFGETLQFVCNENHIEMISKSIDSGKMSVSVEISNLSSFEIEEEKELNMSFSLSPLHNICQFCKIFPEVDIKLHSEYPLYIRFKHEQLSICFFLAPRIVEE